MLRRIFGLFAVALSAKCGLPRRKATNRILRFYALYKNGLPHHAVLCFSQKTCFRKMRKSAQQKRSKPHHAVLCFSQKTRFRKMRKPAQTKSRKPHFAVYPEKKRFTASCGSPTITNQAKKRFFMIKPLKTIICLTGSSSICKSCN